jgi:hypothetical protein
MSFIATSSSGRLVTEIGLLLGVVGSIFVALGAYWVLRGSRSSDRTRGRAIERSATLIGFFLIGFCLLLQLVVQVGRTFK